MHLFFVISYTLLYEIRTKVPTVKLYAIIIFHNFNQVIYIIVHIERVDTVIPAAVKINRKPENITNATK